MTPLWYGGAYSGGAASGAIDWDSYADGIQRGYWSSVYAQPFNNNYYFTDTIQTSSSFSDLNVSNTNFHAVGSSNNQCRINHPSAGLPSYIGIWNTGTRTWHVGTQSASYSGGTQKYYSISPTMTDDSATAPWNRCYIVYFTQDPGDPSEWTDYDTQINWETGANGTWRVDTITYGSSTGQELVASTNATGTGYKDWQFGWIGGGEQCTGNNYPYAYYSNGTGNLIKSGDPEADTATLAFWSINDQQWTDSVRGFCATARFYRVNNDSQWRRNPHIAVFYNRAFDKGEYLRLTPYDGPVANWDTYANGVYIIGTLNNSQNNLIPVPAYPASTYSVVPAKLRVWPMGNNRFAPQEPSNYGTYDGDEAPYVAIYITEEADTANAYGSSAKGWYVFKNDTSSAVYNVTTYETPIAWPSDTSTSNPTPGVNEDGYLGSVNNEGSFVVFLDEYNDPLGAGGTDHWTRPPFVIYNDAPYISSANGHVYPDSANAGGTPIIVNDELHADNYGQGMLRDSNASQFRFYIESHSAYGVADLDIYNNGSLYATGTVNLSSATGSAVLSYLAAQSGFSNDVSSDFDTGDGVTGYPIFIIVWTDTDKP